MRMLDFGSEMKTYRKRNQMTQEDLSEILGVQAKYISLLENGHRRPGTKLQKKMEELLMAEQIKDYCVLEDTPITKEEIEVQMRIFRRLCKLQPMMRAQAVDLICQILDMMSRKDVPKES